MARKSWHLHRRTFLRGTGAAMALPLLESMVDTGHAAPVTELPRRMCCFYFPFGISQVASGKPHEEWDWFPKGTGTDFQFSKTLQSLEPLREEVTVMQGLCHQQVRSVPGHDSGDSFLTGVPVKAPNFINGISLDQLAAQYVGDKTQFPSLVLSSDGGVGEPTRTRTISYTKEGRAISAMSKPETIFQKLFGVPTEQERFQMRRDASILDRVLNSARDLDRRLGKRDQQKLEEYLDSVREVEQRIQGAQEWAKSAKPKIAPSTLKVKLTLDQPDEFLTTMFDLIYLAIKTDTTRLTAYQIGQNLSTSLSGNRFPRLVGASNWHSMGHAQAKDPESLGKLQEYLAGQLSRFLNRLKETPESDGNLLDRTMVLYGSTNAKTHGTENYPLIFAGGRKLGLRHGQYLNFQQNAPPCANLFLTMLDRLQVPVRSFADSTGDMPEVQV
ncbi:MAG: hypothetical protein ACI9G1_006000 [Pirellulaceae bacterium]|jgi:hypothetical protein